LTIGARAAADDVAERLAGFSLDGLVVRTPRELFSELVSALSSAGLEIPILAPWVPGFEPGLSAELLVVKPFDIRTPGRELRYLEDEFVRRWGEIPSADAVYAFDAARLIIEGLRRAGATGRTDLLTALTNLDGFELASGPFHLDNGNGNVGRPVLVKTPSPAPVEVTGVIGPVESSPPISGAVSARR
jgi:hypothetical protein